MESSKIECTGNAQCNLLSVTENNEENTDSVLTFQFLSQFFLICVSDKIGRVHCKANPNTLQQAGPK